MLFYVAVSRCCRRTPRTPYNQLLDEHSLSDTGTSEETDLTTTSVGGEEVDDLDTGNQDLSGGGLLGELRGVGVNGSVLGSLDGTTLVNGVTSDVHDTTKSAVTDGDLDGSAGVGGLSTTDETLGTYEDPSETGIPGIGEAKTYRPWQCNGRCSHPNVAAIHQCGVPDAHWLGILTATSRTSLLPPLSVVKALRMEGSCSVSNLTAMDVSS